MHFASSSQPRQLGDKLVLKVGGMSTSLIRVSTRTTREERSRCEQLRREADERQRSPNTK
jgi:hypothetical protein